MNGTRCSPCQTNYTTKCGGAQFATTADFIQSNSLVMANTGHYQGFPQIISAANQAYPPVTSIGYNGAYSSRTLIPPTIRPVTPGSGIQPGLIGSRIYDQSSCCNKCFGCVDCFGCGTTGCLGCSSCCGQTLGQNFGVVNTTGVGSGCCSYLGCCCIGSTGCCGGQQQPSYGGSCRYWFNLFNFENEINYLLKIYIILNIKKMEVNNFSWY